MLGALWQWEQNIGNLFMSSLTYSTYEIHLTITKEILIVIQVQYQISGQCINSQALTEEFLNLCGNENKPLNLPITLISKCVSFKLKKSRDWPKRYHNLEKFSFLYYDLFYFW